MPESIVLLGQTTPGTRLPGSLRARRVRSVEEVRQAFATSRRGTSLWLAPTADNLRLLVSVGGRPARADRRLLVMQELDCDRRTWLHTLFRSVFAPDHGAALLPADELLDVLSGDKRGERFVAGLLNQVDGVVVLFRGNLEPLTVPLSWFPADPKTRMKSLQLRVADFGQTVRLGRLETAAHAILYDFDPAYRRRAKKRHMEQDDSFGGALRRLRRLRGLARAAFEPHVAAKEIARIESGKVAKPHAATMDAISRKLGVRPEEISSY